MFYHKDSSRQDSKFLSICMIRFLINITCNNYLRVSIKLDFNCTLTLYIYHNTFITEKENFFVITTDEIVVRIGFYMCPI